MSDVRGHLMIDASGITVGPPAMTSDQLCAAMIGKRVRVTSDEYEVAGKLTSLRVDTESEEVIGGERVLRRTIHISRHEAEVGGHRLRLTGRESLEVLT